LRLSAVAAQDVHCIVAPSAGIALTISELQI
jgi:hypothetical protein